MADEALTFPAARRASSAALLERVVGPLDVARRRVLGAALGIGPLRAVLVRKDRRVAVHAMLAIAVAFGAAITAPAMVFLLSPLALGVPHVAADVRYLVLRRSVTRALSVLTVTACAALFALRFTEWMQLASFRVAPVELYVAEAWIGGAIALGAARARSLGRALLGGAALIAIGAVAQQRPELSRIVFAHLHNLVGVAAWVLLFRRRRVAAVPVLLTLGACVALIFAGVGQRVADATNGFFFAGQDLARAAVWLAPGASPRLAISIALSYVFLQSVHYGVWLAWIPQDDTRAEGTVSFRMTVRALVADFGVALPFVVAAALLVAAAPIALGASRARDGYLTLATFHGYLELAMLAYFAMGAPRSAERAAAA